MVRWYWLFGGGPQRVLDRIERRQERIMAQLDDLQASLADDSAKVDTLLTAVAGIATEVADLIARLSNIPNTPDLAAAIAAANSVGTKLQAVSDALSAIPPAPKA